MGHVPGVFAENFIYSYFSHIYILQINRIYREYLLQPYEDEIKRFPAWQIGINPDFYVAALKLSAKRGVDKKG